MGNLISPDIYVLDFSVAFDISGTSPVIAVNNLSTGPNLANITYWIVAASPSGTPIHTGSFAAPDATGIWTTPLILTDSWPMPYNSIEFSGAPYTISLFAQDSAGNVFETDKSASICRPTGNTQSSQNTYGVSNTLVKVVCDQARIFFQDQTNVSYKGSSGVQTSSILKVVYPMDPTYTIPPPFQLSSFTTALVPISYSSDNYQFLAASTYSYDQGNNVSIVIKYQQITTFSVLCNIDLMPLICEYQKLIDSIQNGSCTDVQLANQQLMLINPKFALVVMGIMQPLTGVDVAGLIEDIQTIGGFTCNCCTAASGVIPMTSSVIDGYTFSINPTCGDISGNITQTGSNIQINLADKSYVFNIGNDAGTTAFTVTPTTNGCVKTYSLNIDPVQLAQDILTEISTNAGLVNLFNSIVTNAAANLIVDGKCIFDSTASFNYAFTLANVPSNTTFALVTGINQSSNVRSLNYSLNLTNLTQFQTYLNSLSIGTFVVTNPSGQNVVISSAANPNVLSNLTYSISGTNYIASLTSSATGYIALSANQVVQNIINYLCGLTDSEIVTSADYVINYINSTGAQAVTIPAGTPLSTFIQDLLTYNTTTIQNGGAAGVTCTGLNAIFPSNNASITALDYIYGTKNGTCAQVNFSDAFLYMVSNMSSAAKTAFCAAVTACGAGMPCLPYAYFTVQVDNYNPTCSPIVAINYSLA
jgi:hypothetical protein